MTARPPLVRQSGERRLRLESDWRPRDDGGGHLRLTLINRSASALERFTLAFTSLFPLVTSDSQLRGAKLVQCVSGYQVIAPDALDILPPEKRWHVEIESGGLLHYTTAIKSAYVIQSDGHIMPVDAPPTMRNGEPVTKAPTAAAIAVDTSGQRRGCGVFPWPRQAAVEGSRSGGIALSLAAATAEAQAAFRAVDALVKRLFTSEPPLFAASGGIPVDAMPEPMAEEEYRIDFAPERVTVSAAAPAGWLYAFVTLGQMLRAARLQSDRFAFPTGGQIVDAPRFSWRGMLLDVARQVFEPQELLHLLDCLAWLKINRLHLHLSDDEGWRIAIPRFPQLAERAGWRGHGLPVPPLLGSAAAPYGIVYSPATCRELVARAQALSIALVPEIEMPGHSFSALQALSHLRDPGDHGPYRNHLNPAIPATYDFVEAVIEEVARLFPSPWLHIGADEVPADAWAHSPLARAFMAKNGWNDGYRLQSHFLRRVHGMVAAAGRTLGAWEEAAFDDGLDRGGCYLIGWHNRQSGAALAEQGYDVVLAPGDAYYLDMAQADGWSEPGMDWAGIVTPEACYAYDPGAGWPSGREAQLLGIQACLWGEHLHDRRLVNRLAVPRLYAVAESAWTPPSGKDFRRFVGMAGLLPLPSPMPSA